MAHVVTGLLRIARPHFLAGGVAFYLLGAAAAGIRDPGALWLGQATVTATQLMVHFGNEWHDRHGDALNTRRTPWSGGSGAVDSRVPAHVARGAMKVVTLLALAIAFGAAAAIEGSLGLPLIIFVLAHGYSAPPLRLQTRGIGPAVTTTVVAGLVPLLGFVAQGGGDVRHLLGLAPLACLLLATTFALDLPDGQADADAGKRTPVVRLGARFVTDLAAASIIAAFATAAVVAWQGWPGRLAAATMLPALVAFVPLWDLGHGRGATHATRVLTLLMLALGGAATGQLLALWWGS